MLVSEALAQLPSTGNCPRLYSPIRNIIKTTAHVLVERAQFTASGTSVLSLFTVVMSQTVRAETCEGIIYFSDNLKD